MMNFLRAAPFFWYLIGITVLIEFIALAFFYRLHNSRLKSRRRGISLKYLIALRPSGQQRIFDEIERLRAGGELNEKLLRSMSSADRVVFEVALIDALTKWPDEDQLRLRATLIRHGYGEQCARRAMKGNISDNVRASTLLNLLHEQSQIMPIEVRRFKETASGRLVPLVQGCDEGEQGFEK